MYNESIKKSFLDTVKTQKNYSSIELFFNKCAEIEEILQKDISMFDMNELIGFYKSLGTSSTQYLTVMNSWFGKYMNWCLKNDPTVSGRQNEFEKINMETLNQCINKNLLKAEYVTRADLLDTIDLYKFNEEECFLLLALFEGICGNHFEEIRNLYPENFKKNIVHLCTGRSFEVSKELVHFALNSAVTYTYEDSKGRTRKYDQDDERCFKFPRRGDEAVEYHFINDKLSQIKEKSDDFYAAGRHNLLKSGCIHMIKQGMKETGLSAKEYLKGENLKKVEARYGKIQSVLSFLEQFKEILEDETVD